MKEKSKKIYIDIVCFLYILLFTYAAVSKLLDFQKFNVQLGQSPVLAPYADIIVWAVPFGEIVISLMLFFTRFRVIGLMASFFLMIMFTAYIIIILNFSDYVPCSCGGILEKLGWTEHLIFNSVFIALAFIGILLLTDEKNPTEQEYVTT